MPPTIDPIEWWKPLGALPPGELRDAAIQLHWTTQAIAAVGATTVKAEEDGSHVSMEWLDGPAILGGRSFGGSLPIQVAVKPSKFAVHLQDFQNAELIASFPMDGKTLKDLILWLEEVVAGCLGEQKQKYRRPDYDLPKRSSKKFKFDNPTAFEEMERWIGNAYHAVQGVQTAVRGAGEVRCWPETFNMTTQIQLDDERSIRAGASFGDDTIPEPYFFVEPWPQPGDATIPSMDIGEWHLAGWFGAVLKGTKLVTWTQDDEQPRKIAQFWTTALDACYQLLGAGPEPEPVSVPELPSDDEPESST